MEAAMSSAIVDTTEYQSAGGRSAGLPALHLQKITKIYPGTVALEEVNLEVRYGQVHGLIGKNGAGKSTLVGILAGLIEPTSGTISIEDRHFSRLTRVQAKREGVAIVTQEPEIILDISVAENLFIGDFDTRSGFVDWNGMYRKAREILESAGLDINVELRAGDLSLSERQLILIIKACIVENSKIIILDESSAPLTQKDAQILRKIVEDLRAQGKAVIYISHQIDELLDVCDCLTVLRDGRSITTKDKDQVDRQSLSELIVGEGFVASSIRPETEMSGMGETLLDVVDLTRWGVYEHISFSLRKGEILGIAGLRGSGRTEILKGIAGIAPPDEGKIILKGEVRRFKKPSEALAEGVAYLPEERELEGLIKLFTIKDNIILNSLRRFCRHGFIKNADCEREAMKIFEEVQIKASSLEQVVEELSGGNKQKVMIGRIMAAEPDVYLLDEPTRGVDIGAKKSILSLVCEKIRGNAGVIITSPGLDDLIDICDRVLVLYQGKISKTYVRPDFDEKQLFMDIQGF
jgi:ABC-type sugar transport system ATPase subunit